GGVVLRAENLAALARNGLVVALNGEPDALWARVADSDRPLLAVEDPRRRFEELWRSRKLLYAQAEVAVDTTGLSPEEVATTVVGHWRLATAPGRFEVRLAGGGYPVYIGTGLLSAAGAAAQRAARGRKVALVTNPVVDGLYGDRVRRALAAAGRQTLTLSIPDGEAAKRLPVVEELYHQAVAAGLERDDLVLALGGGTVGDAAGFFAATYLRGLALLQVPTTLLAQVDASVGGKVGVDLEEGKNLVGAFYQPRAVLVDPEVLQTLPGRERLSGLAEVIKHGVLGDPDLFARLERWPEAAGEGGGPWPSQAELEAAVREAVAVKADVVARDERETGLRMALNLGHTAGHAVEKVTGFATVRHGEAVAYGLAAATRIAVELGICPPAEAERITALVARFGLPRSREEFPVPVEVEDLLQAMARDKKVRRGRLRWVLPRRVGETVVTDEVPEEVVRRCL
ncbi:MAG TPA: 3-dehydroquinate synthase, partial [Firmicutes bacterium]|nr:3-dehydroquinate synthase [Bacillota bacterium]